MQCLLEPEKLCDDCGKCDRCDLDPTKLCDNCFKCLEPEAGKDYLDIPIGDVYDEKAMLQETMASACMTYIHVQTMKERRASRKCKPRKKTIRK